MVTAERLSVNTTQVVFLDGPEAEVRALVRAARAHHPDCTWRMLDASDGNLVGALHFWVD